MSRLFRTLIAPAFASAALLVASASVARADYTYTNDSFTGPGAGISVTALSGTVGDTAASNPALFNFAIAGAPVGNYAFSFTESLSSATLGSQTFTVSGTLSIFYSAANNVVSGFTATSLTASNGTYVEPLGAVRYFSNFPGNLSTLEVGIIPAVDLPPSVVPEPASLAMLGLGLVGSVGVFARRRLARA